MLYRLLIRYFKFSIILLILFTTTYASVPEGDCEDMFIELSNEFSWLQLKVFYIVYFISKREGVDPKLVCTVMHYESYDKRHRTTIRKMLRAVSKAGARGIMQVMPYHYKGPKKDLFKANVCIPLGISYLKKCLKKSRGDVIAASRMYNGGLGNNKYTYKNWVNYAIPIMRKYQKLTGKIADTTFSQYSGLRLARQ